MFQLVIADGRPGYRISPSVGVRFDAVEEIFHRTSGINPEYQSDTTTVGVDLWRIFGKEEYQLYMREEADVEEVTLRMTTVFRERALPYFDRFGNLAVVDAVVNDQPTQPCIHTGLPWHRCSVGVIVAKLTGRKNYDELISIYRNIMQGDNMGFYLPMFDALLNDLASIPVCRGIP